MYQLLQPPWMSMSRTIDSAVLVVSWLLTSSRRRIGLARVPFLAEGGLGPLDGLAGQFPVGVQPVGIADHDDDAVLAVAGRQVLGHLGGQVLGRHADVVLAAFDLFFGGRRVGGIAGGGGLDGPRAAMARCATVRRRLPLAWGVDWRDGSGTLRQGLDQLVLGHAVPAGDALFAGHVASRSFWCRLATDRGSCATTPAPVRPQAPKRFRRAIREDVLSRRSFPGSVHAIDPRVLDPTQPRRRKGAEATDGVATKKGNPSGDRDCL